MALNEFMDWFQQAPWPGFTKATVHAWRVSLEERGLGSSSIIIRMSAIRNLAAEAADNGLLAAELAAGIRRVKSVKSVGIRVGNWLSQRQAQALLSAPDISNVSGAFAIAPFSPFYSGADCQIAGGPEGTRHSPRIFTIIRRCCRRPA
jgi:site-specific recombinase XerC